LAEDECIVFYRKGSRGEIVAVYNTTDEIVQKEKPLNNRFTSSSLSMALRGGCKSFKSLYHQAVVVPRIRKRAEIMNEDLNND